ncbi:MAG: hypothetical protein AB7U82_01815 [Blastocatellales bacterium]
MGKLKRFLSDLSTMFFMGVGISTARTKQRKLDLRKLVSGADWRLINRTASNVEYRGQRAVKFDARAGEGLAWIEGLRFSIGKIDLDIAAVRQDAGIAFHVQDEKEFEAICFHVGNEARSEGESQDVEVSYFSTRSGQRASQRARFDLPYSRSSEWFKVRISISKEVIAVFINGSNVPTLRVDNSVGRGVYGSVGLWAGPGSSALVANFRIQEARSEIERQISGMMGKRMTG